MPPEVRSFDTSSHRWPIDGHFSTASKLTSMFQFSGGLLAGQHDNKKERPPPARPIPVTFPSLNPPEPSLSAPPSSWTSGSSLGVAAHFLGLKKPSDVSLDTLALLNVSFQPQCDFETLLASVSSDTESHLPPRSWLEPPEQTTTKPTESNAKPLCNGRKVPDHNEFYLRAKEIQFSNEHAFANLTRKPMGEKVPLRLAHFRKFWESLDNIAYYWDNSLDEYLPPSLEETNDDAPDQASADQMGETNGSTLPTSRSLISEEPRKKVKTEPTTNELASMPSAPARSDAPELSTSSPLSSSRVLPTRTSPPKAPWESNATATSQKPTDLSKGSYKGYRIGNGAEMPESYRLETVRAFLEPIAWAFGVTLVPHRRPPVLQLEHVRFPVRVSTVAWRGPQDRMKARQGWMEGPVLGVQCRADTEFGSTGDLQAESVLDTVRELGGLLLLAQERAREGKIEQKSGEGKWWTTTHRWGGGPGGEVGEGKGASDAPADHTAKVDEKMGNKARMGSKDRRKPTPAEIWKILKPGNPLWDPKVVYEAIGKDHNTAWDDVFMVSSLNHHISVLKLRIHPLYLRYLAEGALPQQPPAEYNWCCPELQRTRWFDLFDIDDRTEAMRGLWGIMSYLMRAQERPDVPMANT